MFTYNVKYARVVENISRREIHEYKIDVVPVEEIRTLFERRTKLCQSYFRTMLNADHKINKLLPNQYNITFGLRSPNNLPVPLARTYRMCYT